MSLFYVASVSNTARAPDLSQPSLPTAQPAQHVPDPASNAVQQSTTTSVIPPVGAHTDAQLVPVAAPDGRDPALLAYTGRPQPDSVDADDIPGQPYKDGRIRNPVPSKLKGKTSALSGKFSVMHMDIRSRDAATDRDLAAKRTSESTALAAQKAFENGYQPHRKSNWLRMPDDELQAQLQAQTQTQMQQPQSHIQQPQAHIQSQGPMQMPPQPQIPDPSVPFTGSTPYDPSLYGLKPATKPPVAYVPAPLSPQETKEHQARLLTLLRTLQPVQVVDQLCKALAYFGGIPDAPPPQDGKFPESAEANGSGSVFVGWLTEIFPDLDAQGRRKPRPFRPVPPVEPSPEKRGRGRPKGSKSSKVRSDKGLKKTPKKNLPGDVPGNGTPAQGDGWAHADDTTRNDGQDATVTERQTPGANAAIQVDGTASVRKRGRPKGSKNRPRESVPEEFSANPPPPISALFSIGKKATGRPKGSKNRVKDGPLSANTATGNADNALIANTAEAQSTLHDPTAASATPPQADPEFALAALKAFNATHTGDVEASSGSFQPPNREMAINEMQGSFPMPNNNQTGDKPRPAKKRKRNAKDTTETGAPALTGNLPVTSTGSYMPPDAAANTQTAGTVVPAAPTPKRQKKTGNAKAKANANQELAAERPVVGVTSEVSHPPGIQPEPTAQHTNAQVYTSPTIEELEAQLEGHDEQNLSQPGVHIVQPARHTQPSIPDPPRFSIQEDHNPQSPHSRQLQQKGNPQNAMARQRQQYQQQQQQQQHAIGRTASPNVSQMNRASPHMSVQSISPNLSQTHISSPSVQQQRAADSQTPTSMTSQVQNQQTANTQPFYSQQQSTTSQPSYTQQSNQQFASSQPGKQQFSMTQAQQQQQQQQPHQQPQKQQQQSNYNARPQAGAQPQGYASQQSQYTQQKHQPYSSQSQSQYASPQQQQYSSQQRVQQQQPYSAAAASAGTSSQSMSAQSPQYGASTATNYGSNEANFRNNSTASMNFNSSAYGTSQPSNAARGNNSVYPASTVGSYGNSAQQMSSSYATAPRRALPTTTSHQSSVQNVQSMPQNMNNFSDFGNLGFDGNLMSGLDNTATNHSNMGLNASYNIGTGNVSRTPAGAANNFGFDSSIRSDGNSYFGIRR